ncbi:MULTISPECIES: hypothetical protein [Bacillus cereus group]|uniref:Uncharacterized protein n=1 Tax=Bacillus thuringiensis TaxID=1428 RepID=A0A9X7ATZ5_BACTU|nr:hypothetical protein [Bacillus thuringiensis]MCQ6337064.1 hypothetical protein [Bacillus cereus]PFT51109.1 hypothetical protein COK72_01295 [Bacillus thuringiensis]
MIIRNMKKEDNAKVKEIIQNSLKSLGLALPGTAYFDPQLNDLHQYYNTLKHYEKCYLETMHELKTACLLYEKFGFILLNEPLPGSEHSTMNAWYIKFF